MANLAIPDGSHAGAYYSLTCIPSSIQTSHSTGHGHSLILHPDAAIGLLGKPD